MHSLNLAILPGIEEQKEVNILKNLEFPIWK